MPFFSNLHIVKKEIIMPCGPLTFGYRNKFCRFTCHLPKIRAKQLIFKRL